jgi:hypothetical protein
MSTIYIPFRNPFLYNIMVVYDAVRILNIVHRGSAILYWGTFLIICLAYSVYYKIYKLKVSFHYLFASLNLYLAIRVLGALLRTISHSTGNETVAWIALTITICAVFMVPVIASFLMYTWMLMLIEVELLKVITKWIALGLLLLINCVNFCAWIAYEVFLALSFFGAISSQVGDSVRFSYLNPTTAACSAMIGIFSLVLGCVLIHTMYKTTKGGTHKVQEKKQRITIMTAGLFCIEASFIFAGFSSVFFNVLFRICECFFAIFQDLPELGGKLIYII